MPKEESMPNLGIPSQKLAEPEPKAYGAKIAVFTRAKLRRALTDPYEVLGPFYLTTN